MYLTERQKRILSLLLASKEWMTDLNLHPSILKIQCLKTRCVTNISIFLKRNFLKVFFRESQLVKDFFWRTRWIPQNRNSRQHITKPEACGGKSSC